MTYTSLDAKILRLAYKVSRGHEELRTRFTTTGTFDREKARQLLKDRGFTLIQCAGAITRLVSAGYLDSNGITASGIAKIESMDAERQAEIDRLGLTNFFNGTTSFFDEVAMTQLNSKDYL